MAPPVPARVRESASQLAGHALDILASGEILPAVAAARTLRAEARLDNRVATSLARLVDGGDLLAAMLALDALAQTRSPRIEAVIVEALSDSDLAEHAAWALVGHEPVLPALPSLAHLIAVGGFAAMPAQLALERWGEQAGRRVHVEIRRALARCSVEGGWSRLVETLSALEASSRERTGAARRVVRRNGRRGLRVGQVLLRGRVDRDLAHAGSAEGGGVVTLLVQLARELGRREDVERSTIIARPQARAATAEEPLGTGASIVRLPFGPSEDVPISAMWEHRVQIERALAASIEAAPIDVAHLRYADAGTFAAARALRRAGVATVFTVAPDPHALIADAERGGRLTRHSFARAERREHNLFRLRLVDDLATRSDRLVTLPRAGGRSALERLLGRRLDERRTASIPEGIAIGAPAAADPGCALVADLTTAIGGTRAGLPLIVSVGRFHPVKGFPRLVEAWAGDPELSCRFNLVLVGGDLEQPTADERVVLDEIERALRRYPAARRGLALLGARPHGDVDRLLSIARHGLADLAAPGGVYACASAKEEFGVSILEALAKGLAVVAPDGGGPATYLDDGVSGILVEPGRVGSLRAGLHRAARLRLDEERAARATALVRERFAIGPMASALAATYRQAVEEERR